MPGSPIVILGFAVLLASAPVASVAASPSAWPDSNLVVAASDKAKGSEQAKNAGTIDGSVVAIDYRAGTMSVQSGSRKVDIVVLPSTNIQGPGNAFHTIADIQKGAHVRVLMSQRGSTFTAQLIHLL